MRRHRRVEEIAVSGRRVSGARRATAALAVLALLRALAACSAPGDVREAERAADATCETLRPLPGVASAKCVVDDGGFDAGIARDTDVRLERGVTAGEAHRVITTWLSAKGGGASEYGVKGSRARSLHLTLDAAADVSFTVAPGAPPPGVRFVGEWLSRAERGIPLSGSVGDGRALRIADEGLSPSAQAALLDEFSMQTRTDRLTLSIGEDSTIESPVPVSLGAILRGLDAGYRGFAGADPDRELRFTVDVFPSGPPRLSLRIPTRLAPALPSDRALTDTPGWPAIRTVLENAAPGVDAYTVTLTARPGQVIGGFSTSGCTPQLAGPPPQFGDELQVQWATIHGLAPAQSCDPGGQ